MTIWFTSDLHFSHKNIVKFTNRGVETTQNDHDLWLKGLWNSFVKKDDVVYHLGDFSFHKSYDYLKYLLPDLNGRKIFFKGNHDEKSILNRLLQDNLICEWWYYREICFSNKQSVVLHHFPISSWHKQGYGAYHLHGHCHGNLKEIFSQGRILDVGIDQYYNMYGKHGFFSEQEIIYLMESKQLQVNDHHADRTKGVL